MGKFPLGHPGFFVVQWIGGRRQGRGQTCPRGGGASSGPLVYEGPKPNPTGLPFPHNPTYYLKLPIRAMYLKNCAFFRNRRSLTPVLLLMLLLGPVLILPAQAQPRLEVPVTVHDFGKVQDDLPLGHTFVIKNAGNQDVKILEVDADCDCTVPNYDRVIPAGGEGKVNLELKPFSVVGPFKKKTKVRFDDPGRTAVTLILQGEAAKSLEILPSHIIRLRGAPEDNLTAQVRFVSHLAFPWEITKFENSLPKKIEVSLKTEKPGKEYVMEVRNKSTAQERYVGRIEVFTNAANRPKIVLRVIADLYPESGVRP
jgi:hypothetical protein